LKPYNPKPETVTPSHAVPHRYFLVVAQEIIKAVRALRTAYNLPPKANLSKP
jgi:hypothetical protein